MLTYDMYKDYLFILKLQKIDVFVGFSFIYVILKLALIFIFNDINTSKQF